VSNVPIQKLPDDLILRNDAASKHFKIRPESLTCAISRGEIQITHWLIGGKSYVSDSEAAEVAALRGRREPK